MFCFTNSRGTFYRPGDTLPALRKLLTENKEVVIEISQQTTYCFDSEAYRFLAAVKNVPPVNFPAEERDNFFKSWEKSNTETWRMIKHISQLKPHPIQNTINLNHARELVIRLTGPLANISNTINANKEVLNDHIEELHKTNATIEDLCKQRFCNMKELKFTPIPYPKTVCTNSSCTRPHGTGDFMQIEYRTICHSPCQLEGVSADVVGHHGLIACKAMNLLGRCIGCSHSYSEHKHSYFDSEVVTKQVESETIKQVLNENMSASEIKRKMIEERERHIQEQDEELKQIEKASVKFAAFLKHNAITPYNDAMLEYMDHFIKEEDKKVKVGGRREKLERMEKSRDSYKKQIEILDQQMSRGESVNILNPSEVDKVVKKLYALKHNGNAIRAALAASKRSHDNIHQYQKIVSYSKFSNPMKPGLLATVKDLFKNLPMLKLN